MRNLCRTRSYAELMHNLCGTQSYAELMHNLCRTKSYAELMQNWILCRTYVKVNPMQNLCRTKSYVELMQNSPSFKGISRRAISYKPFAEVDFSVSKPKLLNHFESQQYAQPYRMIVMCLRTHPRAANGINILGLELACMAWWICFFPCLCFIPVISTIDLKDPMYELGLSCNNAWQNVWFKYW